MNTAPTYLTGAAGAARRAEITARLIAGEPMKAIAAAVGVSVSHVARLAREEQVQRVWLTRPEAALIAQLRAPTLTCPECAAPVNKTALTPQQFPRGGTFWQCPHCAVGCQPTAWKPAAPARTEFLRRGERAGLDRVEVAASLNNKLTAAKKEVAS